jgi:hypothetical protein
METPKEKNKSYVLGGSVTLTNRSYLNDGIFVFFSQWLILW